MKYLIVLFLVLLSQLCEAQAQLTWVLTQTGTYNLYLAEEDSISQSSHVLDYAHTWERVPIEGTPELWLTALFPDSITVYPGKVSETGISHESNPYMCFFPMATQVVIIRQGMKFVIAVKHSALSEFHGGLQFYKVDYYRTLEQLSIHLWEYRSPEWGNMLVEWDDKQGILRVYYTVQNDYVIVTYSKMHGNYFEGSEVYTQAEK